MNGNAKGLNNLYCTRIVFSRRQLLELLSTSNGGNILVETQSLSYSESTLRNLCQSVNSMKSQISPVGNAKGWEPLIRLPGLRSFTVSSNGHVYVTKRTTLLLSMQLLALDLKVEMR